MAINKLG